MRRHTEPEVPRRSRRTHALVLGSLLTLAAVVLAACGGSSSAAKASSGSATTTTAPATSGFAAYAQCLRSHGATVGRFGGRDNDAPATPPTGPSPTLTPAQQATNQAARQACAALRPTGQPAGAGLAQLRSAYASFKSCMADHGYTSLPDLPATPPTTQAGAPPPGGPGGPRSGRGAFAGVFQAIQAARATPAGATAYATCKALVPTNGQFGGFGTATSVPTA